MFNDTSRYLDIFTTDNPEFEKHMPDIYPEQLQLNKANTSDKETFFFFATGVTCKQRTLSLPDTWFRPPLWDLLVLQLLRSESSNLPCLYSTFHLEYTLVFSRFWSLDLYIKSFGSDIHTSIYDKRDDSNDFL